jgi:hypothetical protein
VVPVGSGLNPAPALIGDAGRRRGKLLNPKSTIATASVMSLSSAGERRR